MIARPPEKKPYSKTTTSPPLFSKIANDNYSPKKSFLGWIFLIAGFFLVLSAVVWLYERIM